MMMSLMLSLMIVNSNMVSKLLNNSQDELVQYGTVAVLIEQDMFTYTLPNLGKTTTRDFYSKANGTYYPAGSREVEGNSINRVFIDNGIEPLAYVLSIAGIYGAIKILDGWDSTQTCSKLLLAGIVITEILAISTWDDSLGLESTIHVPVFIVTF